jgi:hypothetical protein
MKFIKLLSLFVLVVALALAATLSVSAQSKKKKHTRRTTRKPAAVKTIPATNGDAQVVSLADQYQDGSTQIIQPNATPSLADTQTTQLPDETTKRLKDIQARIKRLEASQSSDPKKTYEDRQKILLTNLDILTKAEQRSESLRKQRFDMIDKESSIRTRLEQIDIDARPESIEKSVAMMGTLRPEEIREAKRVSLEAEHRNLQNLLNDVVAARSRLDADVQRSDALVEKLRNKLEKDIDDSLNDDTPDEP